MGDPGRTKHANRLVRVDDEIVVEYTMFAFREFPDSEGISGNIPPEGRLLISDRGGLLFSSEADDHYPAVTIELWDGEPPPATGWEASDEDRCTFRERDVRLFSITSQLGAHPIPLPATGAYRCRAYVSGRELARRRDTADTSFEHGNERWLLQLWPEQ